MRLRPTASWNWPKSSTMTTEARAPVVKRMTISGIAVEVVRKDIKNLHLGVYPPTGRVRVATPLVVSDEAVRLAVIDKLGWIKRQRAQFAKQPRQSEREMVNGESHYFLGRRYRLRVHEGASPARVEIRGITSMDLFVPAGSERTQREAVLHRWYREQLKLLIAPMIEQWQLRLRAQVAVWGIRKMKTKWGSCNVDARRIWLNLELAKKPEQGLEYIVVHELVHLLERSHSGRFSGLMDQHLPDWRTRRELLNGGPLGYETWDY